MNTKRFLKRAGAMPGKQRQTEMHKGTLEQGRDPKGPAFYIDCGACTFPVAVKSKQEQDYLAQHIGAMVRFTPKTMGTHTNTATGKVEAIIFATDVTLLFRVAQGYAVN